jgi:hypothetical protein
VTEATEPQPDVQPDVVTTNSLPPWLTKWNRDSEETRGGVSRTSTSCTSVEAASRMP